MSRARSLCASLAGDFRDDLLRGTSKVRRSTIAVIGVLALLGGIAMAMTDALGSGIGLFTVGGLFLMTLFR